MDLEGNEFVHHGNWDVLQKKDIVLYWLKEFQQRHSVLMMGLVDSLYASLSILFTSSLYKDQSCFTVSSYHLCCSIYTSLDSICKDRCWCRYSGIGI